MCRSAVAGLASDSASTFALASLGDALSLAVCDVVADVDRRTQGSRCVFDEEVEEIFLTTTKTLTAAFAGWLSNGDREAARRDGIDPARIFVPVLAARNDVPLNEVTKRVLRWHDAVAAQLNSDATRLGVEGSLPQALFMLQRSLHVTLVRMTEAFEMERQRLHQEVVALSLIHI